MHEDRPVVRDVQRGRTGHALTPEVIRAIVLEDSLCLLHGLWVGCDVLSHASSPPAVTHSRSPSPTSAHFSTPVVMRRPQLAG